MRRIGVLLPVLLALQVGVPPALAWTWPAGGPVLQYFKFGDDPYAGGQHRGIDISASAGAPVVAPAGGAVSFAGTVPGGGHTVTIETPDGYSVTLVHLGTVAVSRGAEVAEGDTVGTVGPSGTPEVAGPYVHLGIRLTADDNGYIDPLGLLPRLADEQPAPDPAAGIGGAAVPAADPVEAAPAVDPAPTSGADPPSNEPPSQPPVAVPGTETAPAVPEVATTPTISLPSSAPVTPGSEEPDILPLTGSGAPPAAAPAPTAAAPAGSASLHPETTPRPARSSNRSRRAAGGERVHGTSSLTDSASAASALSPVARQQGHAGDAAHTPRAKGPGRHTGEPSRSELALRAGALLVAGARPAEIAAATRPVPPARTGAEAPASAGAVPPSARWDGGLSAWIVALAAAGALAAGAWLGHRRPVRTKPVPATGAEPTPTPADARAEPEVAEASVGEVSAEDLRALDRELERLLGTTGSLAYAEHEPADLPPALEWAR